MSLKTPKNLFYNSVKLRRFSTNPRATTFSCLANLQICDNNNPSILSMFKRLFYRRGRVVTDYNKWQKSLLSAFSINVH